MEMASPAANASSSSVDDLLDGHRRRRSWSVQEIVSVVGTRLESLAPAIGALQPPTWNPHVLSPGHRTSASGSQREPLPLLLRVPVGMKETIDVAVMPTSWGIAARGRQSQKDAVVVARL